MVKPTENKMKRRLVSTNPMLSPNLLHQGHTLPLRHRCFNRKLENGVQLFSEWLIAMEANCSGQGQLELRWLIEEKILQVFFFFWKSWPTQCVIPAYLTQIHQVHLGVCCSNNHLLTALSSHSHPIPLPFLTILLYLRHSMAHSPALDQQLSTSFCCLSMNVPVISSLFLMGFQRCGHGY